MTTAVKMFLPTIAVLAILSLGVAFAPAADEVNTDRTGLALGGYDPKYERPYVMYFFSGGGYGGWWETDGLTNGCSTVGISRA